MMPPCPATVPNSGCFAPRAQDEQLPSVNYADAGPATNAQIQHEIDGRGAQMAQEHEPARRRNSDPQIAEGSIKRADRGNASLDEEPGSCDARRTVR